MTSDESTPPQDLYDAGAVDEVAKLVMIQELERLGYDSDESRDLVERGDLAGVAPDLALLGPGQLTIAELSELSAVPVDLIELIWLNTGMPVPGSDVKLFYEADVDLLHAIVPMLELFEPDVMFQMLRVVGSSMARIAGATETAFVTGVERRITESGGGDADLAAAAVAGLQSLRLMNSVLGVLLGHHIRIVMERGRATRDATDRWETAAWAIGFVDLAGYTSLSEWLEPADLAALVSSFEQTCHEVITAGNAMLVKLIGDEAMFAVPLATTACDIVRELLDRLSTIGANAVPRAGMAFGEVITKDGDFHGPVVNLAARACDIAVPDEILVSDLFVHAVGADYRYHFEPAGRRQLKGFAHPQPLWTLER